MMRRKTDDRVSLWDLQITRIQIGGQTYQLDGEPKRGGSCLVYGAKRCFRIGEKEHEQNVLLKEFYPLLDTDQGTGIRREKDGTLVIPEATKTSLDYQKSLTKFQDSVRIMLEMSNSHKGADHSAIPLSISEGYGTWYVEEINDSGHVFAEFFYKKKKHIYREGMNPIYVQSMKNVCEAKGNGPEYETMNYDFHIFLQFYKKAIQSLINLHEIGYYHLDCTPKNLSATYNGTVKLFDTDTFVKSEELDKSTLDRYTEGYAAPELMHVICHGGDASRLIGPWTDIYSMTQVLCWYLYGYPLDPLDVEEELDLLEEKIQFTFGIFGCQINSKGVERLKKFIRTNLSVDYKQRFSTAKMTYTEVEEIRNDLFEWNREKTSLQKSHRDSKKNMLNSKDEITDMQNMVESLKQEGSFVGWHWGLALVRFITGLAMVGGGSVLIGKAAYLMSHKGEIGNIGLLVHLIGNGMMVTGVCLAVYCFYEFWMPHGWKQFVREYYYPILTMVAAVFSYTFPPFFAYRAAVPPNLWDAMDQIQKIVETMIFGGSMILLFGWIRGMKERKRKRGRGLNVFSLVLFVFSLIHLAILIRCGSI